MSKPKVSIIMIVYKQRKDYFMTALTSVYKQTIRDKEIIVSSIEGDESLEWAKIFPGVKTVSSLMPCPKRQINEGVKVAEGEYIIHVDSDDFFYQNAIKQMYDLIIAKDAVLVYSYLNHCDRDLRFVYSHESPEFSVEKLKQACIINDCALIKKSVFEEFGTLDVSWKKFAPWNLYLKMAEKYSDRMLYTGKPLAKYRRHWGALGVRAFRGEAELTGETLRSKFYEKWGIVPDCRNFQIGGNRVVTEFGGTDVPT